MLLKWTSIIVLLYSTLVRADEAPEIIKTFDYHFQCPGMPETERRIEIAVRYDEVRTTYRNIENAEVIGTVTYVPVSGTVYYTLGTFKHGMCLPASKGRKCGYAVAGTLQAFVTRRGYGAKVLTPSVTQQCTEPGNVAENCGSGKLELCKIIRVDVH